MRLSLVPWLRALTRVRNPTSSTSPAEDYRHDVIDVLDVHHNIYQVKRHVSDLLSETCPEPPRPTHCTNSIDAFCDDILDRDYRSLLNPKPELSSGAVNLNKFRTPDTLGCGAASYSGDRVSSALARPGCQVLSAAPTFKVRSRCRELRQLKDRCALNCTAVDGR